MTLPNIVVTFGNNLTYQDDIYITLPGVVPVAPVPTPTLVTCTIAGSAMRLRHDGERRLELPRHERHGRHDR